MTILSSLPDILRAFVHHYENLFASQVNSVAQEEALRKCISINPNNLAVEQHAFCEELLSLRDLKEASFSMADDKSPRCDGFPYEFYKHLWEKIGSHLHKVYLEAYHSKILGAIINKGNIKFICKASDPMEICN